MIGKMGTGYFFPFYNEVKGLNKFKKVACPLYSPLRSIYIILIYIILSP